MKVVTLVLDAIGNPRFRSVEHFNVEEMIVIAKSREAVFLQKGSEWARGSASFFGSEIIKAVETGENADVTKAIIDLLMSIWLNDFLFCGVTEEEYVGSEMSFIISPSGVVSATRKPKTIL